ncbi:MAG: amidohydrolase family protein [Balneola sp.]|jgi:imidazolonepropionase-like amidohydrolase
MKRVALPAVLVAILVLTYIVFQTQNNQTTKQKVTGNVTAFTNVSVIPMTSNRIIENHTVVIRGDEISLITPSENVEFDSDATIIDGTGKFLIPGLAEMHGHVPPTDPPSNAPRYMNMEYVENTLFLYTAAGITTVRGMLGWANQLELKDKVSSQEIIGPSLYLAGPSFNGNSIGSVEEAASKVRQQKEEGWDLLKIHPGLTLEEYDAMAQTANEIGITFGGHIPSDVGIIHAIEMGQETIDHMDGYVAYLDSYTGKELDQKIHELIALTKENNVWVVPTQALWETILGAADYDALREYDELKYIPKNLVSGYNAWTKRLLNNSNFNLENAREHATLRQRLLSEMNKSGVKILMGTDAPQLYSVPGFSIHRELKVMSEAGMSPYEILVTGTKNVGEYFSHKDNFGTIEVGQRADLILLDNNPLDDISNLRQNSGVMVAGRWLSRSFIDEKLADIEASYEVEDK